MGTVGLTLRGGTTMRVSLPICAACHRRRVLRVVVGVAVGVGAFVGSAVVASRLYPPGHMRGVIIGGTLAVAILALVIGYRLTPMARAVAEHEGGVAGSELYVRFANATFEAQIRAANGQ